MSAEFRPRWWLWPNLLALDAPCVALLWQDLMARSFAVHLGLLERLLLALVCWIAYAADYLIDGLKQLGNAPRHRFFFAHRRILLTIVLLAGVSAACVAFRLPRQTLHQGLICGAFLACYFTATHASPADRRAHWPRELSVAALFSGGSALCVSSALGPEWPFLLVPSAAFAVLCWINVSLIEAREPNSAPSTSAAWISQHIQLVSLVLLGASVLLYAVSLLPGQLALAIGISAGGFIWMDSQLEFSSDAVRVLADAVLCTPALVLLLRTL